MVGGSATQVVGGSAAQDVKQRALQVVWKSRLQPTEAELGSAFRPFGAIVHIQIKGLCAAILFDSAESVAAAAESSWDSWDVRPMMKTTSKGESASSLKAAKMGRKHETPIDRTASSAVGGGRASRPRTAGPGLETVRAEPQGVDLSAMELDGSATSKEDSDTLVDDATRMRNAYSNRSVTKALSGDRAQGQGGGVHSNSREWETVREKGQPAGSSKESLRPVDDDCFAPRQRSSSSLSSRSDDGEGADAPINRTTRRSMRETNPRSHEGSYMGFPMDQRQTRLHSTGGTSITQEGSTPRNRGMVDRAAVDAVAFVAGIKSEPVPNCYALDAAGGESDVFWQNLSPLSSLQGLATPMRTRDKEGGRQKIDAEEVRSDPTIHVDGRDGSRAFPADRRIDGNVGDGTAVPLPGREAMQEEPSRRRANPPRQLSGGKQPRVDAGGLSSPNIAPAAAIETACPLIGGQAEDVGGVLGRQVGTERKGQGVGEGKDDDPAAEQKRARHQAKRLALEVSRLRAALRRTASDLKTERTTRERLEEEWWKKMGEWEEERGCLVAAKQEADRASREAAEETALVRKQAEARHAKTASDRDAQEAAQRKADSAMNGVVKVQDRLVRALQAELDMTNRAREATQDDAREATEQLRFYVQDFLMWRDRAKRLEARMVELGHPKPWIDPDDGTAHSRDWPLVLTSPLAQHPSTVQRKNRGRHKAVQQPESAAGSGGANDESPSNRSDNIVGSADNSGTKAEVSGGLEEKCAQGSPGLSSSEQRGSGEVGGGAANTSADMSVPERHIGCFDSPLYQPNACIGAQLRGPPTVEAAPAWPSGLAVGGGQSPASRAYFQRSMEAQQEVSARLERDLVKARADLQAIYGGDKAKGDVGVRVGLVPGGTATGRYIEGRHDVSLDADSLAGARGEERKDNGNIDGRPLSSGGLSTERGGSVQPQHPTSQHSPIGVSAPESDVAPVNSRGPYMIRVLAALLGENTIAEAAPGLNGTKHPPVYDKTRRITEQGLKNSLIVDAPPPSLRLTDFSPTLQAVFGEGKSVLPATRSAMSGRTLPAARERDGEARRQQGLRHQACSGQYSNTGERNGEASQIGTRSIVSTANVPEHPGSYVPTVSAALSQSSRDGGGDKRSREKAGAGAASDLRGSASCALAGAFREYEAKSPLLQRWMLERFPSPSGGTPVV